MKIKKQILTHIFNHEKPEDWKHLRDTFYHFRGVVQYETFRDTLREFSFEMPQDFDTLCKWARCGKSKTRTERAFEFIQQLGGEFSKQELHKYFANEIFDNTHPVVSRVLLNLQRGGKIERIGRGQYQLTTK